VPFTLGTSFTFTAFYHTETTSDVEPGATTGDTWDFSYKLTEADGITPVPVLTPEPGPLSLLGAALAGLALFARVRAYRRKT
jgi:hypothetical protein